MCERTTGGVVGITLFVLFIVLAIVIMTLCIIKSEKKKEEAAKADHFVAESDTQGAKVAEDKSLLDKNA